MIPTNSRHLPRKKESLLALGLLVLCLGQTHAQVDDSLIRVPVRFHAYAKSPSNQPPGEMTYFEAFLGSASIYGQTWTPNTYYATSEAVASLVIGGAYSLSATYDDSYLDGPRWQYATVYLAAPAGYELRINGVPGKFIKLYPYQYATIQVLRSDWVSPVGESGLPPVGKVLWQAGLGQCPDGSDAGALEIRRDDLTGVFSPAALQLASRAWADVELVYSGGAIRQTRLPSRLVDVVTVSNGYELRYYASGSYGTTKVNGVYPINPGAQPFTKYFLENAEPATGKRLRITQTTGSEPEVLEVYYDSSTKEWRRTLFADGQGRSVLLQKEVQSSPRTVELTLTNAAGVLAEKTRATYQTISGAGVTLEVLTEEVRDYGGHNYTKQFGYDTSASSPTFLQKLWEKRADGGWIKYEYYTGLGSVKQGLVYRTYEPFKDTPSGPEGAAANVGVVTTFDYQDSSDPRLASLLTSREQRIDGKLVFKTLFINSLETLASGRTNVVRRIRTFYGVNSTDYLETIEKRFDTRLTTPWVYLRDKVHSVTEPTGRRTSFLHQRGSWDGATFTPGTGDYTRTLAVIGNQNSGTGSRLITSLEGTANIIESVYVYPNQSLLTVELRSPAGQLIRTEERVLSNASVPANAMLSDFAVVGQVAGTYDQADHLLSRTTLRGTEYSAVYGNGRLQSETDLSGTTTGYVWGDHDLLLQTLRYGVTNSYSTQATVVTSLDYDAAGRVLTSTTGTGAEQLIRSQGYDLAGELVEAIDPSGVVRTRAVEIASGESHYSIERLRVLDRTVNPEQVLSEIEIQRHRDGRTKQSTGSGKVAEYWSYSVPADGAVEVTRSIGSGSSPRYERTTFDLLGRIATRVRPKVGGTGTLTTQNVYSTATGLLEKRITPGLGDTFFSYDPFGQLQREGIDVDGGSGLQEASQDRIVEHDLRFVKDASNHWWLQTQGFGFPEANQTTKVLLTRSRERLTGFSAGLSSDTFAWGVNPMPSPLDAALSGPARRTHSVVYPADKRIETKTDYPDATNDDTSVVVNGRSTESTDTAGLRSTLTYDALGRLQQSDEWTGNSDTNLGPVAVSAQFEYVTGSPLLLRRKERNGSGSWTTVQENGYYANGALKWGRGADGRYTRLAYNSRGQLTHRWGDGVTPERQDYDSVYGQLTDLRTYRGGSGWDTTALPSGFTGAGDASHWTTDAATGLPTQQTDAAGRSESWAYDAYNRELTHTSPRNLNRTLSYDSKTGEILGRDYSDSTPDVAYSFTRLGLLNTVTDATGTRTFHHRSSPDYKLSEETLPPGFYGTDLRLRPKYNASHARLEGMTLGVATGPAPTAFTSTHLDLTYSFESGSARLSSLQSSTRNGAKVHSFSLGYLGNSSLISTVSGPQTNLWRRWYEPYRPVLRSVSIERAGTTYARYQYTRDDLARIDLENQDGVLFQGYGTGNAITIDYDYNARGQLERATSRVNNNSYPIADRFFEVNYDHAANRTADWRNVKDTAHQDWYTPTSLNQYNSRGNRGYQNTRCFGSPGYHFFRLTSPYAGDYYPSAQGGGSYLLSEIPRPGSSAVAEVVNVEYRNVYGGFYENRKLPYRRAAETFQYDYAGNLTSEDLYAYQYDAEDRLTRIVASVSTAASKDILYDYLGRRVEEKDYAGSTLVKWRRFIWDGWALIAEVDVNVSTQAKSVSQTFTWGPDVSGSIQGAGNIGGLLLVDKSSTEQFVAGDDGRGNVTTLLDALATSPSATVNLKAGVEYGPFGEIHRNTGDLSLLPFRFQSKWALGRFWQGTVPPEHLDFGRRVYSPRFGRFLSRDPVGESAGANLYHYCNNDPVNWIDPLGLSGSFAEHPALRKWRDGFERLDAFALAGRGSWIRVWHPGSSGGDSYMQGGSVDSLPKDAEGRVEMLPMEVTPSGYLMWYWVPGRGDLGAIAAKGWGSRFASWLDRNVSAPLSSRVSSTSKTVGFLSYMAGSTVEGFADMFRLGEGTAYAVYEAQTGWDIAIGVSQDIQRAAGLAATAGGAALATEAALTKLGSMPKLIAPANPPPLLAAERVAAKTTPTPTRFINGVKVTDRATGNVLEGTVDLKPTLDRIASGQKFPHRNDGSIFRNDQGLLPRQSPGYYTEYVHPTPGVSGPGPQRIVTGQGGEFYYTPDHYRTFIPLNP